MPHDIASRTSAPAGLSPVGSKSSVLIVDDDTTLCGALARMLTHAGYDVTKAFGPAPAIAAFQQRPFDVVLSDLMMPKMTGVELLTALRTYDTEVPFILMTGSPTLRSAVDAVSVGAIQYLTKPSTCEVILESIEQACRLRREARMKREVLTLNSTKEAVRERLALETTFNRALASMWMDYQPIVNAGSGRVFAYEALVRAGESKMCGPAAILDAAERLGRLHQLGRRVRALSARGFKSAPPDTLLFVNLHPEDLLDPELYERKSALGVMASRVVLEITERASIEDVKDMKPRLEELRRAGYKIAIDDLGAGYSGLSSFVALEPEIVKIDMSLVRNAHKAPVQERVMQSITTLCKDMGISVVAEGIEIEEERSVARKVGCELLQGYLFARPGPISPLLAA